MKLSYAETLDDCYRKAETKMQTQACLKDELASVKVAYDDILKRGLMHANNVDREKKSKNSAQTFNNANKAYDQFVLDECSHIRSMYGSGAEADNAFLACQINLIRSRTGILENRYLTDK